MACVGRELLCALDFTFLQGTFLQGEVSLPRRGRKPEELLIHDLERAFRLDSNQRGEDFPSARGIIFVSLRNSLLPWTRHSGVTVFPSARGSKKPLSRRGRKPEDLEQAPQRLRMAEWLLVRARATDKARIPRAEP